MPKTISFQCTRITKIGKLGFAFVPLTSVPYCVGTSRSIELIFIIHVLCSNNAKHYFNKNRNFHYFLVVDTLIPYIRIALKLKIFIRIVIFVMIRLNVQ